MRDYLTNNSSCGSQTLSGAGELKSNHKKPDIAGLTKLLSLFLQLLFSSNSCGKSTTRKHTVTQNPSALQSSVD